MKKAFTDRSRIETHQRCHRLRWHEYHDQGMGIRSAKTPLPLAVGGSVHAGQAILVWKGQQLLYAYPELFHSLDGTVQLRSLEEHAVKVALEDFKQFDRNLEVDVTEMSELGLEEQLMKSLGAGDEELAKATRERVERAKSEFDTYLFAEQSALVEGLVRAYARRRLRPLLEQYEVLEVEREGMWLLADWKVNEGKLQLRCEHCKWAGIPFEPGDASYSGMPCPKCNHQALYFLATEDWELRFMSRPDALLRERLSNDLYVLSYKTTGNWDVRKARDAQHDMQGLSEGVDIERRLGEWWHKKHKGPWSNISALESGISSHMIEYLQSCTTPPRIMGIRYEYILKDERRKDKDLSARLEVEARTQRSPLVWAYLNGGMAAGDEQWNWSWDYHKDDGSTSKLYWKNWHGTPVFEHMTIREWIEKLDRSTMTVGGEGEESRDLGYSGPAQTTGFTQVHPLDTVFIEPLVIYRNDDDLRDWIEQVEAQERGVTEAVELVNAVVDEGERRHLLNVHFPQSRKSCEYPATCAMVKICYGGEDIRRDPLGSGLYKIREVNHPQEVGK